MNAPLTLLIVLCIVTNLFVIYRLFEIEDYLKRRDRDDPQNAPTEIIPVRKRKK